MVYLILVDLGYLDSCIVIAPHNVKFDTTALCNYTGESIQTDLKTFDEHEKEGKKRSGHPSQASERSKG